MGAEQVFKVLTEFRFDIGHAVVGASALQSAVGGISKAADDALISFQKLGIGLVAQMGLGTGSFLGVLNAAIQASDKFGASQRQIANIFLSNNLFSGANSFEESMSSAARSMETIRKKAQEFALPAGEMTQFTKLIGATLISHGLDDSSLTKSMNISRGFLKSAPTLGIDPMLAQGQLLDAVLGRASLGDTLFQRLMNETSAMKQFKGAPQKFNALGDDKRVKILTDALLQFGSNAKVLAGNARSLTGELQRLRDSFIGMFSILKPIGDVLLKAILPSFHKLNNYLQKQGLQISTHIAKMIDGVIGDPEKMAVNLMQLRRLKGDVTMSGTVLFLAGLFQGLHALFKFIRGGGSVATAIGGFTGFFKGSIIAILWNLANGLVVVLSRVFLPLAGLITLFQLISRAIAIAHVEDLKAIVASMPKFTEALAKLKQAGMKLAEPFIRLFDAMARSLSVVFRFSYYFDALISLLDWIGDVMIQFQAGFAGILAMIQEFMHYFTSMNMIKNPMGLFDAMGNAFNKGADSMIEEILGKIDSGGVTANQVTNINKVEINNAFKEQMEPDRIAFTLKEQLLKAAANRGQASGRSLRTAEVGGY